MKTLQEIKDEVAQEYRCRNWRQLSQHCTGCASTMEAYMNKVAKKYAEQAIDQCGEIAELEMRNEQPDPNPVYHVKTKLA